jgi:hypothetical protein
MIAPQSRAALMAHSPPMADPSAGQASLPATAVLPPTLTARFALTPERRRLLRANALVFMVTFLVYWALGPHSTPYDYQLSQANNIIHGHLDMTEQYTRNLRVLERVLYDGQGFCLPIDDPRAPESYADNPDAPITANCRNYMQHSLGPALMLVPVAMIWDIDVGSSSSPVQPLISAIFGGLTALFAFAMVRHFTPDRRTQIALTALAVFGTTLWYTAASGSVWYFAHTTAVFFLFAAIYATVVRRNALLAGALFGAAFMCRPTTILGGVFALVAFSDQWLNTDRAVSLWQRVRPGPLVKLAAGVTPFVLLTGLLNYLRFSSPFESGYSYSEQFYQLSLLAQWPYGIADLRYLPNHVHIFFEQMPNFADRPPFVWPSWWGLAMWVTTPAIVYPLFIHLKRFRGVALVGGLALAAACAFMLLRAIEQGFGAVGWGDDIARTGVQLLPFWVLLAGALVAAAVARDRLVLACWAAILAIALVDWTFAATGWAQFGYRYGLDFMPFLFLLIVVAVGQRIERHHEVLIGIGVLVNLWGVLWIFQFSAAQLFGWTWVSY